MSAWEVTIDDLRNVLNRHKIQLSEDRVQELYDGLDHEGIEVGVLAYTNMADQTASMLEDIERYLIEEGVIPADKAKIYSPWEPTNEVESDGEEA